MNKYETTKDKGNSLQIIDRGDAKYENHHYQWKSL